ncbi:MAG: chorismate mutase [Myxococcaceae bacterium]|jgi:chorismate mutase|nr:chorismate mutase [Myxococcaceae bacterium]
MTPQHHEYLETTRRLLDNLDDALVDLLAQRAEVVAALWAWKAQEGLDRTDTGREETVLRRLLERATAKGLDPLRIEPVLRAIIGKPLAAPPR